MEKEKLINFYDPVTLYSISFMVSDAYHVGKQSKDFRTINH